jgi:predicted ArsR family transcriptional regulator
MTKTSDLKALDVPLERDLFMRKMLRELTGTLEDVVGVEDAAGYVSVVGSAMGQWIDKQYRQALSVDHLDVEQVSQVFVDLKGRIGGDFYIVSCDENRIVIGNRTCPFGQMAHDRPSMCMMTSNVFGRIAADNLGYARVELQETIAQSAKECRIVVHLEPRDGAPADEREYYSTQTSRTEN